MLYLQTGGMLKQLVNLWASRRRSAKTSLCLICRWYCHLQIWVQLGNFFFVFSLFQSVKVFKNWEFNGTEPTQNHNSLCLILLRKVQILTPNQINIFKPSMRHEHKNASGVFQFQSGSDSSSPNIHFSCKLSSHRDTKNSTHYTCVEERVRDQACRCFSLIIFTMKLQLFAQTQMM